MGESAEKTFSSVAPALGRGGKSGGIAGDLGTLVTDPLEILQRPFTSAADEQDARFQQALDEAAKAKVTTEQTRDLTDRTRTSQDSRLILEGKGRTQQRLEQASLSNFQRQQQLAAFQEAGLKGLGGIQQQGRDVLGDIAGGQAFALSPEEQARIDQLRGANIAAGTGAVNELLNQRLAEVQAQAAARGVRGQALSQLQTGAVAEGARSLERQTLEANRIAAEQALALPGQRVGIQAGVGQGLATIQQQAQQQAIENRQLLQNPALLQQLQQERLATGRQRTTGTSTTQQTGTISGSETGGGVAALLAARAQAPGQSASTSSGLLSALGAGGQAAGGIGTLVGALALEKKEWALDSSKRDLGILAQVSKLRGKVSPRGKKLPNAASNKKPKKMRSASSRRDYNQQLIKPTI